MASSNASDLQSDAALFRERVKELAWQPEEWSDEGEICFEWIAPGRHAIVSIEGDGEIGYAMLVDGKFIAGDEIGTPADIPRDLGRYLSQHQEGSS